MIYTFNYKMLFIERIICNEYLSIKIYITGMNDMYEHMIYMCYHQTSNISHLIRQQNCWSFRCSWSIACRRCSNYIFIVDLTSGWRGWENVTELSWDILKMESWTHMGRTANIIIKDVIHIFASISKIMRILLMGRRNRERCVKCLDLVHLY